MDRLKAGSLILAIIFLIVGLLIDRGYWTLKEPEFIENMIAEVFGICLGVFVALYIVDKYKEREWDKFRNITYRETAKCTCNLVSNFKDLIYSAESKMDHEQDLKLSSRIFNGKYQPNHDTIDAMSEIAETVRYLFDSLQLVEGIELTGHSSLRLNPEIWPYVWVNFRPNAEEREKIKATAIEDFKRSQGDLDLIQVVLFPRVIRCNDQEIITAIAELDSAIIDLRRIIPIYEDMPNSSHSVIYSISQLLGKCQQLYSALCEKWVIDE